VRHQNNAPDVTGDGFSVAELEGKLPMRLMEDRMSMRRDDVESIQS